MRLLVFLALVAGIPAQEIVPPGEGQETQQPRKRRRGRPPRAHPPKPLRAPLNQERGERKDPRKPRGSRKPSSRPSAARPSVPVNLTDTMNSPQTFVVGTPQEDFSLELDLFVPPWPNSEPWPVILWLHGGAWRSRAQGPPPSYVVQHGYALAALRYRLSQDAVFPAQLEDCKAAVRWLRAHADELGIDAQRLGVLGTSAGGHLAALMGTTNGHKEFAGTLGNFEYSSDVGAVCDLFGPTNFLDMDSHLPDDAPITHDEWDSPESLLIGGPIQDHPDLVGLANPVNYVTSDDPPFLILHGENDRVVPVQQSEILFEALRAAGVPANFFVVQGASHGWKKIPPLESAIMRFFEEQLRRHKRETQNVRNPDDTAAHPEDSSESR